MRGVKNPKLPGRDLDVVDGGEEIAFIGEADDAEIRVDADDVVTVGTME